MPAPQLASPIFPHCPRRNVSFTCSQSNHYYPRNALVAPCAYRIAPAHRAAGPRYLHVIELYTWSQRQNIGSLSVLRSFEKQFMGRHFNASVPDFQLLSRGQPSCQRPSPFPAIAHIQQLQRVRRCWVQLLTVLVFRP